MSREFEARFRGPCHSCGETIERGDRVRYADGTLSHVECPEVSYFAPGLGERCPRCFCVHRGEC